MGERNPVMSSHAASINATTRFFRILNRASALRLLLHLPVLILIFGAATVLQAAELLEVSVLDKDYLVVHLSDGEVIHNEGIDIDTMVYHSPSLASIAAGLPSSWTISSAEDANYGAGGRHPIICHRKTKLGAHAQLEWMGSDFAYESADEHWIYLKLPSSLQQGLNYSLEIDPATNSDTTSVPFNFDVFSNISEAVHVNLVGYAADAPHKAADLYHWMGDGGQRDYSGFEGNAVWVYDVDTGQTLPAGAVSFWKASSSDVFWYNLTRSSVWTVDFPGIGAPGRYRLVVDGVGCSPEFKIANEIYRSPFEVAIRGYFYTRVGETNPSGIVPPPRTPLYIPAVSPPTTVVYRTSMHPWHPEWATFTASEPWDMPDDWVPYRLSGNPTNPDAWGGHADAADLDRHLQHVANIYDMLLPFLLTDGAMSADDTGITESGNGIPDILDEARYEVDFWLRLRDGDGYSYCVTNPNASNELFQAGATAIAAWANSANAAMLADAFRIAGFPDLVNEYRIHAVQAYTHADGLVDPMLDEGLPLFGGAMRGRDLKMTAAAFLYNLTGVEAYEDVIHAESVCSDGPNELRTGSLNQLYASAAYLMTPQTLHFPTMQYFMKTAIISQALSDEAEHIDARPSRRATDDSTGYFHTAQNVQRCIIAHAVAEDPVVKDDLRKALALEADWGLGRNPLNMIQMTTAFTALESKRSVTEAFTSGLFDGFDGVHPGHTPFMNLDDWAPDMVRGRPSALYESSFPEDPPNTWPIAETYFPSRWVWAHNEYTPRQTMRGKMALYGYLYGLDLAPSSPQPRLSVVKLEVAGGSGTVVSSPPGIDCGTDCNEDFADGTEVTLTATPAAGSSFGGWGGACQGTDPSCTVVMTRAWSLTATFEPVGTTYLLSVETQGSGGGVVISSPPGIECGVNCYEPYLSGTSVMLTAEANPDSEFSGWQGICSGLGDCNLHMNADLSVQATFRLKETPELMVYEDELAPGWANWSFGAFVDLAGTSPVKNGNHAVNVILSPWGTFSAAKLAGEVDSFGYEVVKFWLHGGTGGDKVLRFFTESDRGVSSYVDVTAVADTWTEVSISMEQLGHPDSISQLYFMNYTANTIGQVSLDDLRLEPVFLFRDGFESGDTSRWSVGAP